MGCIRKIGEIALLALPIVVSGTARSQAIAESASATAGSSLKVEAPSQNLKPQIAAPQAPAKAETSAAMVVPEGPPGDEINRNKFESEAGPQASRLLLRSTPTGATVSINHLPVGKTPLLLFVAPGKYEVSMLGERQETGSETVGLLAGKTQTVLLELKPKYPTKVNLH